jgi:hypothetical protein
VLALLVLIYCAHGFPVERRNGNVPGIWKLVSSSLPFEQDIRSKFAGLIANQPQEEILIRLNPDGTFKQCNEDYQEGKWISGRWCWKLVEEEEDDDDDNTCTSTLMLAMNRQYFGPPYDVLLEGKGCDDNDSKQRLGLHFRGQVLRGKFAQPTNQAAFFDSADAPMTNPESLGPFTLTQVLATSQLESSPEAEEIPFPGEENQFQMKFQAASLHNDERSNPLVTALLRIGMQIQSNSFCIFLPSC